MRDDVGGRYAKISARFWRDERVVTWPDDQKLLALFLLTSPHRNSAGYYVLPLEYAATDLRWPMKKLRSAHERLIGDGFVAYDEGRRVVLVRRALKYDRPDNPNQIKAAVKQVEAVPASPLLDVLCVVADEYAPKLAEALRDRFARPAMSEPLAEGFQEPLLQPFPHPESPSRSRSPSRITQPHSAAEGFAEPNGQSVGEPDTAKAGVSHGQATPGPILRGGDPTCARDLIDQLGLKPTPQQIAASMLGAEAT